MKISFIGLGKLGLPFACCLAEVGNEVLAIDNNEEVIKSLKSGDLHVTEPGLEDLYNKSKQNIYDYTTSYERAIAETDCTVILVNTQEIDGGYGPANVEKVLFELSEHLKNSQKNYHFFVLSSTVLPGTIKNLISQVEKRTNRIFGEGFGLAYVPDFVALGEVVHGFQNPDFVMTGTLNKKDRELVSEVIKNVHKNDPPVRHISIEEAEIAKVSFNAYVINKITFANYLGKLCEKMENVNVNNVTETIGLSKRIMPSFFSAGTPWGGACYPRDITAFIEFSQSKSLEPKHMFFAEEINQGVYSQLFKMGENYDKIGILGISFKPGTPVITESPSLMLVQYFLESGKKLNVFDRLDETFDSSDTEYGNIYTSSQDCIDNSDIVYLMHRDEYFKDFDYSKVDTVDPWKIL